MKIQRMVIAMLVLSSLGCFNDPVGISTTRGEWTLAQGAMVFQNNKGLPAKFGAVEGNKLTIAEPNFVRVFTK